MYDPKFEKEVQQKMEELEFSPSDAVWTNIEQAVNADRKRRRLPFFWMFFLSGMLLLGAGIVYKTSHDAVKSITNTGAKVDAGMPVKPATTASPSATTGSPSATPASPSATTASPSATTTPITASAATPAGSSGTIASSSPAGPDKPAAGLGKTAADPGKTAAGPDLRNRVKTTTAGPRTSETGTTTLATGSTATVPNVSSQRQDASGEQYKGHMPGLASFRLPAPKITGAHLPVQKTSGLTRLSEAKRPWEAAFTGGGGVSSFNQTIAHQSGTPVFASPNFSYFAIPAPLAYNAAISKDRPSSIEAGPAFYAGVLARKPLSVRWAVTIGLDLSYYSTRVRTGPIVNGYSPATFSLISAAAAAPIQTYPYYTTGDDQVFTNRYYSLEVPATVQWQINHSRTLPLFLESGLSFSYLVSSDALYYNSHSGVYFKDRDVVNRAQVNFMSSLLIGLPLGGVNLQAGPQVEYGLTSLLRPSAAAGQHLFYGGLRVVIIPKGKK